MAPDARRVLARICMDHPTTHATPNDDAAAVTRSRRNRASIRLIGYGFGVFRVPSVKLRLTGRTGAPRYASA
jgi:hypothetical protein